jgi:glutamate carboxypeptidase
MSHGELPTFEAEAARLLGELEVLVRIESPSDDAAAVTRVAAFVEKTLRREGIEARRLPCPPAGDALVASVGAAEGGTLLLGHLDTVWPIGSFGADPWRRDGDRVHGPGVFDMKAGIAVAMTALRMLGRQSDPPPATLLLVPDEETGSGCSRGLTVDLARRHRRVLVLEPSAPDGAAKVARKGGGTFRVRLRGRAAHAGLEPENGASALAEMARLALFASTVAAEAAGTTVTPTVARAGRAANVVPEEAELTLDARAWTVAEAERVDAALRAYVPADSRVEVKVAGGFDRPPLEPTEASERLYETARRAAAELGFDLGQARVGGASDGNLTAAAGIPTLDGLGPAGAGAHARDEHVLVPDLARRVALVTALLPQKG